MEAPVLRMAHQPYKGLKFSTIIVGSIGMLLWGCGVGFPIGYCISNPFTLIWSIVFVPLNMSYIYFTMKILYSFTGATFPSETDIRMLRMNCSKLVSSFVVGFALFIIAICWFANNPFTQSVFKEYTVAFGCSFSFLWTLVLFIMVTVYTNKVSTVYFGNEKKNRKSSRKSLSSGYHEDPYRHVGPRSQNSPPTPVHGRFY